MNRPAGTPPGRPPAVPGWRVIVPVKRLAEAKSRLVVGPLRPSLALAFAVDTISAVLRSPTVNEVTVVTNDPAVEEALNNARVNYVRDAGGGLNCAIQAAVDRRLSGVAQESTAIFTADLPAIKPDEVTSILRAALAHPRSFVADLNGTGTTGFFMNAGQPTWTAFGAGSRMKHRALGACELRVEKYSGLVRDVDTVEDLDAAVRLGVGPVTARICETLGVRIP